jgi:hypothetical protein
MVIDESALPITVSISSNGVDDAAPQNCQCAAVQE